MDDCISLHVFFFRMRYFATQPQNWASVHHVFAVFTSSSGQKYHMHLHNRCIKSNHYNQMNMADRLCLELKGEYLWARNILCSLRTLQQITEDLWSHTYASCRFPPIVRFFKMLQQCCVLLDKHMFHMFRTPGPDPRVTLSDPRRVVWLSQHALQSGLHSTAPHIVLRLYSLYLCVWFFSSPCEPFHLLLPYWFCF